MVVGPLSFDLAGIANHSRTSRCWTVAGDAAGIRSWERGGGGVAGLVSLAPATPPPGGGGGPLARAVAACRRGGALDNTRDTPHGDPFKHAVRQIQFPKHVGLEGRNAECYKEEFISARSNYPPWHRKEFEKSRGGGAHRPAEAPRPC